MIRRISAPFRGLLKVKSSREFDYVMFDGGVSGSRKFSDFDLVTITARPLVLTLCSYFKPGALFRLIKHSSSTVLSDYDIRQC